MATQARRRGALARASKVRADLVVDLSDLTFADASLMFDLAMLARRLRLHGWRLLLRGAQPHVARLIQVVGLHSQPGVQVA